MRLSDFVGAAVQAPKALEAIQNPDCGWFYRRNAETFKQIPGIPISYWLGDGLLEAYSSGRFIDEVAHPKVGMQTSNNEKFLRLWWETDWSPTQNDSNRKWIKYLK